MHHEHCKPYWQRCQDRNMGIASVALRVGCRENGVDQNEGADDFSGETNTLGVAVCHNVGSSAVPVVVRLLEGLDQPGSADGSQTLGYHVQHCSRQRHFSCQKEPKCHCGVNVSSCRKLLSYYPHYSTPSAPSAEAKDESKKEVNRE
eukprot:TRINITY_DN95_c0_g1_i3.p3 TRINITY_DN95_c0_g1~~TRINITY_DN95_c0_g1_i3.p3  ORF type:complete len:147 (-),score=1.83 TRINITY_DN95_c0_g1_i3:474-914(-)